MQVVRIIISEERSEQNVPKASKRFVMIVDTIKKKNFGFSISFHIFLTPTYVEIIKDNITDPNMLGGNKTVLNILGMGRIWFSA